MSDVPLETRALRQMVYSSIAAFLVGFLTMFISLVALIIWAYTPDAGWISLVFTLINALMISVVFGGFGTALIVSTVLQRYHYWRGYYRCHSCDKRLKGLGIPCDCLESQRSRWALQKSLDRALPQPDNS